MFRLRWEGLYTKSFLIGTDIEISLMVQGANGTAGCAFKRFPLMGTSDGAEGTLGPSRVNVYLFILLARDHRSCSASQ
jgi:hypothetical protein